MTKKNKAALAEEAKAITSKWKTLEDVDNGIMECEKAESEGTISIELSMLIKLEIIEILKRIAAELSEREERISRPE